MWFEWDHPRSRGVYTRPEPWSICLLGSSPLARGLLHAKRAPTKWGRIIPARAGFTTWPLPARQQTGDHPRSRGVYLQGEVAEFAERGSSPLARGLPWPWVVGAFNARIIPARAGFTPSRTRTSSLARDHPRSRGVYPGLAELVAALHGSSPLARGLPARPRRSPDRSRIIPARAGFTCCCIWRRGLCRDHPRSHGVYPLFSVFLPLSMGSSPLARGLLSFVVHRCALFGIIPARAGFTILPRYFVFRMGDHPRSRGVYTVWRLSQAGTNGSSPLARGLLGTGG